MAFVGGNARTSAGNPVDYVTVFDWITGACLEVVTPATTGEWEFEPQVDGDYGVTFVANGFKPVTRGPYFWEGLGIPTVIGEAFIGGFYAGDIEDGGKWYKLIVADVEADVKGLPWMDPRGNWPDAESLTNGPANTESMRGDSRFDAGNHCLDYRGGGFDDWYMPARSELQAIYENLGHNKTPPAGFESGGAQAFHASHYYWCSTQSSSKHAWIRRFSDGNEASNHKYRAYWRVRPVRRLEFTP